jgi:SSS family transporter
MIAWFGQHRLQLAFLGGYLALVAYHGWKGKQKSGSLEHYLIGGRSLGGVLIALSFYSTFVSSVTFVGHAGRSYTLGMRWWVTCVVVFSGLAAVAWFVVAPRFILRAREWGSLTIPDFLGYRYRSPALRRLAGVVVVVTSLIYLSAVYDGAGRALQGLLEVPENSRWSIIAAVFVVVTLYTLAGGFHSVVATDAVQGLILLGGALLLPAAMIWGKGGLGGLIQAAQSREPQAIVGTSDLSLAAVLGLALGVGMKFVVEPRQLGRFYGLAGESQLRRGRWIAPGLLMVTYLCMLPVGFLAHAYVPAEAVSDSGGIHADRVVPYLLGSAGVLGPIGGAFFLTALVAAAMSSLDSVLLVAASSVDHDVIAPQREHAAAMRHTRVWVVLLSALAAGLAAGQVGGIVEMSSFSGSLLAACFLPALVIGLFWQRATLPAALASLVIGFAATMGWFVAKRYTNWQIHELYVGLACSLPAFALVSTVNARER